MISENDLKALSASCWMASRIPVLDALIAFTPKGMEAIEPPRPVYETRWYPEPGGVTMKAPYDGGPFDQGIFRIEVGGWDHTTCDLCNARIPAMTLCYVTREDPYHAICESCFQQHVAAA